MNKNSIVRVGRRLLAALSLTTIIFSALLPGTVFAAPDDFDGPVTDTDKIGLKNLCELEGGRWSEGRYGGHCTYPDGSGWYCRWQTGKCKDYSVFVISEDGLPPAPEWEFEQPTTEEPETAPDLNEQDSAPDGEFEQPASEQSNPFPSENAPDIVAEQEMEHGIVGPNGFDLNRVVEQAIPPNIVIPNNIFDLNPFASFGW